MDTQELQRIKNRYDIIGNDAALNLAIEMASVVAPSDLAVLITGENGSGKDVIPRIIHDNSRRRTAPFLAVNCGAIPVGTINAELFGHEKGSFTGAVATRKGYFEEADGGTLFLDEIGELPRETQAMLLRVLQDGEYLKVGSSKVEKTNVRVIAATNINLQHAVETGKFREDLYYRLNAFQIKMPALRDRKDDIYLLFRKFTSDFSERSRLCKISLTHEAISVLKNYRWPGNVRQLKNFTEALTVMESRPVTPTSDRIELDAPELLLHMPREAEQVLPAIVGEGQGSSRMSDDDVRAIVKAILDLKQEVDRLKKIVDNPAFCHSEQREGIPPVADDAEWQESQPSEPAGPAVKSIRQSNDELYAATLAKYDGKVKPAAAELGVSERTIYRWLSLQKKSAR
ncbi:MAG: sigma-54-dependent Fis family transcriptional regulator [Bacteroidales bacterium]|nr:sigma-54-dependent Fis family transcriptional regulator [Bacteroidales bacterium]